MSQPPASSSSHVFTTGATWRAIGFEMTSEARADEVLAQASDKCTPVAGDMKNGVFISKDRSGAVLVFDVVDEKIQDIHEDFAATTTVAARWVEMPDRFALVDFRDANGQTVGQACVALRAGLENQPGRGGQGELAVAALAQRVELYEGARSYANSETARIFASAHVAPHENVPTPPTPADPAATLPTFISMGAVSVLSQKGAHAGAVLAGEIAAAELHSNTLTGQNFWVIEANVGFPLTICVGESDMPSRPRPNQVIAGEFVIVAADTALSA
ncbi:hypothetical protein [Mobiluncus mulieris]|uniref:Uncharacterized protein n=1 Tax=Mobiluncus mulieris TaxID=2052 RepID=A0A7Y0UTI9_9ACTO|nr:hypothetical protein [Mobiluncus mulieris]NMX03467.1 hypothetical protein [Mobiluncus mulieris]NMX10758.1 hypothetical protein [Mobiluncus mulieris]